jgi:hypothetical protein
MAYCPVSGSKVMLGNRGRHYTVRSRIVRPSDVPELICPANSSSRSSMMTGLFVSRCEGS